MSDSISATHQYLLTHFGPLLTLKHLAEVLHSTPNGLRMAMYRKKEPFTIALAGTRRKVGRRLFFEARKVAAIIDQDRDELTKCEHPANPESDNGTQGRTINVAAAEGFIDTHNPCPRQPKQRGYRK